MDQNEPKRSDHPNYEEAYNSTLQSQMKLNAVAAYAQQLPFKNNSFDETIANHTLFWIDTRPDAAIQEMLRVTNDGGYVKIHPAYLPENTPDLPLGATITHEAKYPTLVIPKPVDMTQEQLALGIKELLKRVPIKID